MRRNKILCLYFSILITIVNSKSGRRQDADEEESEQDPQQVPDAQPPSNENDNFQYTNNVGGGGDTGNCWLNVNAKKHFEQMDALDEKHLRVREAFQRAIADRNLNDEMLEMMVKSRAAAERAVFNAGGKPERIPAGINLGGYGMLRLENSILFFHRMKVRNETKFRVNFLTVDVLNMVMTVRLALNDLHLRGQYERAITDRDALFYRPTFGELELLLKGVYYKAEGRLRLVQSRLMVEHMISSIFTSEVLMMYYTNGSSNCQTTEKLDGTDITDFLERMRADLDAWLKDYFNDYLLYFGLTDDAANHELHCYEKQKEVHMNDFMDHVVNVMKDKLYSMEPSAANVKMPDFSLYSINGVQIKLHSGVVRGMDTFHRLSVTTGRAVNNMRHVDAIIGFSKLRVEYKYMARITGRTPPMMGLIVLTADDLIAHLIVMVTKDPSTIDIAIKHMGQVRSQTLVIEGAINRMVGNFKHLLENEIISLMINSLLHNIRQLNSLTKCEPTLQGYIDEGEIPYQPSHDHNHENGEHNHENRRKSAGGPSPANNMVKKNDNIVKLPGDKKLPPKNFTVSEIKPPESRVLDKAIHDKPVPNAIHQLSSN